MTQKAQEVIDLFDKFDDEDKKAFEELVSNLREKDHDDFHEKRIAEGDEIHDEITVKRDTYKNKHCYACHGDETVISQTIVLPGFDHETKQDKEALLNRKYCTHCHSHGNIFQVTLTKEKAKELADIVAAAREEE